MAHLTRVFKANGFPQKLVKKALTRTPSKRISSSNPRGASNTLHPLHLRPQRETRESLCTSWRESHLQAQNPLKQLLVKVKEKPPEEKKADILCWMWDRTAKISSKAWYCSAVIMHSVPTQPSCALATSDRLAKHRRASHARQSRSCGKRTGTQY